MILALLLWAGAGSDATALLAQAQDAFRQGDWGRADRAFTRAAESASLLDDRSTALEARLGRMDLRLLSREPDSARGQLPPRPDPGLSAEDSSLWCAAKARLLSATGSDSARPYADSALSLARRGSMRSLRDWAYLVRARIRLLAGDLAGAEGDLDEVKASDSPVLPSRLDLLRARTALARHDAEGARRFAVKAWESAQKRGDVPAVLEILPVRADGETQCRDPRSARASWTALQVLASSTGLPRHEAQAREALSRLAAPE